MRICRAAVKTNELQVKIMILVVELNSIQVLIMFLFKC